MKELRLQVSEELHRQLKQMALDKGATLKSLLTSALEKYVRSPGEEKSRRQGESERAK